MREQQIVLAPSKQIMVAKEKCRYDKDRCLTTYVGKREGEMEDEQKEAENAANKKEKKTISYKVFAERIALNSHHH